jgi:hypothetical protein
VTTPGGVCAGDCPLIKVNIITVPRMMKFFHVIIESPPWIFFGQTIRTILDEFQAI